MSLHVELDPTADRVVSHDNGRRFDERLERLTLFALNMLYESSTGLTVRQISRKHRVPEAVIRHLISTVELAQTLGAAGISSSDAAEVYSPLVQRLEELAAPRCHNCRQVLRKALEPRKRGRPARYCDAICRAAGAKNRGPLWQTGYLGTCHNYLHGCKCRRKDSVILEDNMVIITPSSEVLLLGTLVGHISHLPADYPGTVLIEAAMLDYERAQLAEVSGTQSDFVPTCDITRHTAIRLYAGFLHQERGVRKVAIQLSARLERLLAKGFDFRAHITVNGQSALVWNLEKFPPPPVHVVA